MEKLVPKNECGADSFQEKCCRKRFMLDGYNECNSKEITGDENSTIEYIDVFFFNLSAKYNGTTLFLQE